MENRVTIMDLSKELNVASLGPGARLVCWETKMPRECAEMSGDG